MKLTENQSLEVISSPHSREDIEKGKMYESALRIYTEEKFKENLADEEAWSAFLTFVETVLSQRKFLRIQNFIKYPLPVVNIGKGVLKDIYKVFDSMNAYFHVEYLNKVGTQEVSQMLNEISLNNWLVRKGKDVLKNKPNSIVVVDKNEVGDPYLILVDTDRLIDLKVKEDSSLEYIAFIHSIEMNEANQQEVRTAVYDDEFYRVFLSVDGGNNILEIKEPHGIGYCPARMFMSEVLSSDDNYNRQVPLSPVLSWLQEWQQFEIFTYYTDHYGVFPVVERPEENCSVDGCKEGKIYVDYPDPTDQNNVLVKWSECPSCSGKSLIGPGSEVKITPKLDKEDTDSAGIFKFISPDIKNLEHLHKKLEKVAVQINLNVVGENEILKVQAVNDDQVAGSFEAKKTILINWKSNFDVLYTWTATTLVKAKNPDTEVVVHANFGTEFYLSSEEDLQNLFENAIKIGLPVSEIDMIYKQLVETKYKGNPSKIARMNIIRLLDPDPYTKPETSLVKFQNGMLTREDLIIKSNLIKFVDRFELENGSIVEFGKDIDLSKKIAKITETFKTYFKDGEFNDPQQEKELP